MVHLSSVPAAAVRAERTRSDHAMAVLQYATAFIAIAAAVLLAGLR